MSLGKFSDSVPGLELPSAVITPSVPVPEGLATVFFTDFNGPPFKLLNLLIVMLQIFRDEEDGTFGCFEGDGISEPDSNWISCICDGVGRVVGRGSALGIVDFDIYCIILYGEQVSHFNRLRPQPESLVLVGCHINVFFNPREEGFKHLDSLNQGDVDREQVEDFLGVSISIQLT